MKPQPLIAVRDVEASSAGYRRRLGCQSGHGGREYEQLVRDGELLMQLHHWGDHDHPNLGNPDAAPPGHGVSEGHAAIGAGIVQLSIAPLSRGPSRYI